MIEPRFHVLRFKHGVTSWPTTNNTVNVNINLQINDFQNSISRNRIIIERGSTNRTATRLRLIRRLFFENTKRQILSSVRNRFACLSCVNFVHRSSTSGGRPSRGPAGDDSVDLRRSKRYFFLLCWKALGPVSFQANAF